MCALNISNYFWSIFYYYDHKRRTNFEQKSSLQPGIRNWKSVYWKSWFFLDHKLGRWRWWLWGDSSGIRRGSLSASSAAWCITPTDFGESSSWSLKHGWRSSEFFSGLQSTYQSSWNKSYDIWIKIRHVIKDW